MLASLLADAVVVLHAAFIVFVIAGGLAALRWRRLAWLHVPAVVWVALLEFNGWICPLTPLEQHFRRVAGQAGYTGGFIDHYLIPLIYPAGLTPAIQFVLGVAVVALNVAVYGWMGVRARRAR